MAAILAFLFVVLTALNAEAAPSVSGVSGTVAEDQSITISGSAFGGGPTVVLFDDFEGGTSGAAVATGAGSAKYGQWMYAGDGATYSNLGAISGNLSARANPESFNLDSYIQASLGSVSRVYYSWNQLVPTGTVLPAPNWKVTWIMGTDSSDDDRYVPGDPNTGEPGGWVITGNDNTETAWADYVTYSIGVGTWIRSGIWLKGGTNGTSNDGESKFYTTTGSGTTVQSDLAANTLPTGGAWERVRFNAYSSSEPNCSPLVDDVYIATGDNAQARVEIGNASTYAASTKLTILTPTSWASNSITATVNQSNFVAEESGWLFVIDSTGTASSGYPVTIGGAAADTTAPTVQSASVNGTTVTSTANEPIVTTGYDANDCSLTCTTAGTVNLTNPTGTGATRTFTGSSNVAHGDTCTLGCTLGTDDIEDAAGNDMATFSGLTVTVNTPAAHGGHWGPSTGGGWRNAAGAAYSPGQ